MENDDTLHFFRFCDTGDGQAFFIFARVAARGDDDVDRKPFVPLKRYIAPDEPPVGTRLKRIENIALEEPHVDLTLGVAETGVELQDFNAVGRYL